MNNDPRHFGGQEYAPPHAAEREYGAYAPTPEQPVPQPVMRPAPQSYSPDVTRSPQAPPPSAVSAAAIAASDGAPAPEDGSEVVTLSRSYQAHGLTFRTLHFRKPNGADLRKYGYPIRQILNPDTGRVESIEINAAIASKYVVALSSPAIPPSTIDQMDIHDADACNGAIVRFFMR